MKNFYLYCTLAAGLLSAGTARAQRLSGPAGQDTTQTDSVRRTEYGRLFNLKEAYSTGAVSSVSGQTLYQTPVPNLSNTLYGQLPGLTVSQRSGEPGNDAALLGIRGVGTYGFLGGNNGYSTYKIYVDGFEVNSNYLNSLSPVEIESVSVLKDAAALSTFGMRGSNGVIWVETRRGTPGKTTITAQVRSGADQAININKPLNAYQYANLYNQARSNDNGNSWMPAYTNAQLQAYQNGSGTNIDWFDEVLKDQARYTDADVSVNGGNENARFNVVMNYVNQEGLFDVNSTDSTSNELLKRYNLRANLDFNLFKIFTARVDLGGRLSDQKQPNFDISSLWSNLQNYPANIYPIRDGNTDNWSGTALYPNNPVASVQALGWQSYHNRILQGNFGLKEDLSFITPGLYLDEAYSFNSYFQSSYNKTANYARYYNGTKTTTDNPSPLRATGQSPVDQQDWKQGMITLGYEKTFKDNHLAAALNYHQSDYRGEGAFAFAYHYQNISGRANYAIRNKYIAELGFSWFGNDAYAPGNRWGFYPAVSAGWILSNEEFLKDSKTFSFLKLRASVGKTGGADTEGAGISISGLNGRYLYQQYYQSSGIFYTGTSSVNPNYGLNPIFIANPDIFAEQSIKYNAGADLTLFSHLQLTLDAFMDKRSDIITVDNSIPDLYGNNILIKNLGKMTNKGFEASALYSGRSGAFSYQLNGMASFNKNTIDYEAEVTPAYPYNAVTGRAYGTKIGLVATGFYQLSDFNADGSLKSDIPVPQFGPVQPGDLRYADLDGDQKVDNNDRTEIGKPYYPELSYAFGGSFGFLHFDLAVLFQGTYGSSINLLDYPAQSIAFVGNTNAYALAQGAWAYYPDQDIDTRATATYPRLTTMSNDNNYRISSFWIKSGDFLRIRNITLGYSIPGQVSRKLGMQKLRIFVNAVNPVTWSPLLKDYNMDPETLGGYSALRSFNAGITASF